MGGLGGEAWKEAELERQCGLWVPMRNEGRRGLQEGLGRKRREGEGEDSGLKRRVSPFGKGWLEGSLWSFPYKENQEGCFLRRLVTRASGGRPRCHRG